MLGFNQTNFMIPISAGMVITQDLPKELETIEIDNKYEDCLFMKLEGTIVQPDKIDLFLTINFHYQFLELPGGSIKLGLTGGELRLNLTNGKLPYSNRGFNDDFKVSIEKKRRSKQASKIHQDKKMSMGLDPTSNQFELNIGTELNLSKNINHEKTDEFTIMDYQITSKGGETSPAWVFAAKSGDPLLTGTLSSIWLGSITKQDINQPCYIEAIFTVLQKNIHLYEAEGIWFQEISREERAVLDRKIVLFLLKRQLKPYVSRLVLQDV